MKIFQLNQPAADFDTLVRLTQEKVLKYSQAHPQELVVVKGALGAYEMQLQDIPASHSYLQIK